MPHRAPKSCVPNTPITPLTILTPLLVAGVRDASDESPSAAASFLRVINAKEQESPASTLAVEGLGSQLVTDGFSSPGSVGSGPRPLLHFRFHVHHKFNQYSPFR